MGNLFLKSSYGVNDLETATLGAGCFWGVEHVFRQIRGVEEAEAGYAGGCCDSPTYAQVCADTTGHAEVVRIQFDPAIVSYDSLLDIFWQCHNPTTLNRQGEDCGTQYRSVIYWHSAYQKDAAEKSKERAQTSGRFPNPIVTEIAPAPEFFRAEEHHQKYYEKNGAGGCTHACPIQPPLKE